MHSEDNFVFVQSWMEARRGQRLEVGPLEPLPNQFIQRTLLYATSAGDTGCDGTLPLLFDQNPVRRELADLMAHGSVCLRLGATSHRNEFVDVANITHGTGEDAGTGGASADGAHKCGPPDLSRWT